MVLPADTENFAKAAQVELVQFLDVPPVESPSKGLTTSQLTSGKPWPRTGRPGGQLYVRAQSTLKETDHRAWMIRDRPGRTECQTQALLYLVSSAARSALPLSNSKLICVNTSTDASSSKSKDYYYYLTWYRACTTSEHHQPWENTVLTPFKVHAA